MRRLLLVVAAAILGFSPLVHGQTIYLAFGDSITFGTGDTDESETGYPSRLQRLLGAEGIEARVENHGLRGETTAAGLSRIGSVLNRRGDYVLIMEGTNDILVGGISMETTAFNLVRMAERAQQSGKTPVLSTIIPIRPNTVTTQDEKLATLLRNKVLGPGYDLVDHFGVFENTPNAWPNLYNTQRRDDPAGHPNAAGYDVLAQNYADVLLGVDRVPPVLGEVKPANGASGVSKTVTISVVVFDHGAGLDTTSTRMLVNGSAVSANRTGSARKSTFTYRAPQPLSGVVTVEIEAQDRAIPANSTRVQATRFSTVGTTFIRGDINQDGRVDGFDLVELAYSFGKVKGDDRYRAANDLDKNNKVDGADLAILANNFGKSSG